MIKKTGQLLLSLAIAFSFLNASAKETIKDTGPSQDVSPIINGTQASVSTYPWMVFLADAFEEQYCGASLISETWVLTAAHCFLNEAGDAVDIVAGAESIIVLNSDTASPLASSAEIGQIGRIVVHPDYNPDQASSDNVDDKDIALVELTAAVSLQPVQLLSAANPVLEAGTQTLIMGWGTTAVDEVENTGINPSDALLTANQQIVSRSDCETTYGGGPDGITDFMICAGAVEEGGTTDTCQGDSGGPMLVANGNNFVQVGIVSFGGTQTGPACGDPDAPGVYASISALAGFIQEHVSDANFVTLGTGGESTSELSITVDGTMVNIQWTAVAGATGYTLYYAPFPQQEPISSLDMGSQLSVSGELPPGSAFYVAIEAYDESGSLPGLSNVEVFTVE